MTVQNPCLFVDADACPVKDEVYRVAQRTGCAVFVVANSFIRTPSFAKLIVVDAGADAADDWIAARIGPRDIAITNDFPLASRCLDAGAQALSPAGKPFTAGSIGAALAGRAIMEHLRSVGEGYGGPPPFSAGDRSRFLNALDAAVTRAKRVG